MQQELVYPYGTPQATGILKDSPADFQVTEELGFDPSGEGEHLFLWVEKSGLSTPELINRIARDFSLAPRHIGYSGLKDKHAVTRQWLSLHLPGKQPANDIDVADDYRILRQARHHKKLRPGTHKFNTFRIRILGVTGFPQETREQLQQVVGGGFANYFGAQRFGRKQDNVSQALAQLSTRKLSRARKGILLSSLRSFLFNEILRRRISRGYWQLPLAGDVFMLRGSHSIFAAELDEGLINRYRQLDISSTASLYGTGPDRLSAEPHLIESRVFAEHVDITHCLDQQGAKRQMRPLRAIVEDLNYDYDARAKSLLLEMRLPTGCYVTTLLNHFVKLQDASQGSLR